MLGIVCIFYIVKAAIGVDLPNLRKSGWVFDVGEQDAPWYQFYSYFSTSWACKLFRFGSLSTIDFKKTSFSALVQTMPTQLALLFFNILHPPLNVPALGEADFSSRDM